MNSMSRGFKNLTKMSQTSSTRSERALDAKQKIITFKKGLPN